MDANISKVTVLIYRPAEGGEDQHNAAFHSAQQVSPNTQRASVQFATHSVVLPDERKSGRERKTTLFSRLNRVVCQSKTVRYCNFTTMLQTLWSLLDEVKGCSYCFEFKLLCLILCPKMSKCDIYNVFIRV